MGWLAARTDPNAAKHRGISTFVVDMNTPGIEVRPLVNMADEHNFNEVFFEWNLKCVRCIAFVP